jgi:KaiC/GvpD/RAD55 family RecA-like ATPase
VSKLTTGIEALDRKLDGGFPSGTLVGLVSPPDAPSSRILHELMKQRASTYVTTLRPKSDIATELMRLGNGHMDVDIEEVGEVKQKNEILHTFTESEIYSANIREQEQILDEVNDVVQTTAKKNNLIIDPVNPLENSESRLAYQELLRTVASKVRDVNGLGVLHCLSHEQQPSFREETLTMVDAVWNLEMGTDNEGNLALKMSIPKNRGGELIFENTTLLIDRNRVYTDISRGI